MFQNAALEFQNTPVATLAAAMSIIGGAVGFAIASWTYLSSKRTSGDAPGENDLIPDFRIVLICMFVMPVIASGFALIAMYAAKSLGFVPAFILGVMLAGASTSVTGLLSGVILGPWLRSMYHERTINKAKHGYYGPLAYADYSKNVGFVFGWLTYAIFLMFLVEPTYARLQPTESADSFSSSIGVYACLMIFGPTSVLVVGMFGEWAGILFRSQAKTF